MSKDADIALIVVYKAPDMVAAHMVKGLLDNNNVPATIRSLQIPMYNDVAMMQCNTWGEILVPKTYEEKATGIIKDYLESIGK